MGFARRLVVAFLAVCWSACALALPVCGAGEYAFSTTGAAVWEGREAVGNSKDLLCTDLASLVSSHDSTTATCHGYDGGSTGGSGTVAYDWPGRTDYYFYVNTCVPDSGGSGTSTNGSVLTVVAGSSTVAMTFSPVTVTVVATVSAPMFSVDRAASETSIFWAALLVLISIWGGKQILSFLRNGRDES